MRACRMIMILIVVVSIFCGRDIKVFVSTFNMDAYITKNIQGDIQKNLAQKIEKIVSWEHQDFDILILNFQEVKSCSDPVNGLLAAFWTDFDLLNIKNSKKKFNTKLIKDMCFSIQKLHEVGLALENGFAQTNENIKIYKCDQIIFFKALGTIVCKRIYAGVTYDFQSVLEAHYGEYTDWVKFGFKGAIGLLIKIKKDNLTTNIASLNFHLSSKSLEDRRSQLIKSINLFFKSAVERTITEFTDEDSRIYYFFSGDVNARTGSNMIGINDNNFYSSDSNTVYAEFNKCHIFADILFTDSMQRSLFEEKLKKIKINSGNSNCFDFHKIFMENDEYYEFFHEYPVHKNAFSCANPTFKANSIAFTAIYEVKIDSCLLFVSRKLKKNMNSLMLKK